MPLSLGGTGRRDEPAGAALRSACARDVPRFPRRGARDFRWIRRAAGSFDASRSMLDASKRGEAQAEEPRLAGVGVFAGFAGFEDLAGFAGLAGSPDFPDFRGFAARAAVSNASWSS